MKEISARTLRELKRFDTPTICNSIDVLGLRPKTVGYTGPSVRSLFPERPPAVGFASTATFRSTEPAGKSSSHPLEDLIETFSGLDGPAFVVVEDLDNPPVSAVFGEIMCTELMTFGAVGLATNGMGRDFLQIERLGFPVLCSGLVSARGYSRFLEIGVDVRIGGLPIRAGDLIHADGNGLVAIPLAVAESLVTVAEGIVSAESLILERIREKPPSMARIAEARRAREAVCQELLGRFAMEAQRIGSERQRG